MTGSIDASVYRQLTHGEGAFSKPLQNHPRHPSHPPKKNRHKNTDPIRCISPFATGVYCLLDSCIPTNQMPRIWTKQNGRSNPTWLTSTLDGKKTMNNLKMPTWKGEKNIHSNGLNLCVSIFLRIDFVSFIHFRKRRKRRCPKTKPRFSLRLKRLDRLKNSLVFSMKFVTNPEFKQLMNTTFETRKQKFTILKKGFAASHMSVEHDSYANPLQRRITLRIWISKNRWKHPR